jgi:hypothetical protein
MIFSEKGRGAPFLRKNHPWILQPLISNPVEEPTYRFRSLRFSTGLDLT